MAKPYDHRAIEKKWQEKWSEQKLYETADVVPGKKNQYVLFEFPYPSGDLHVGHWYAYSMPDAYARMKRMQGYNVLFPFGYDCFGLPAENAALTRGMSPAAWIDESVEHMRAQVKTMGASLDWSRELATSSPEYYRWTQWLFLKFYEHGIAYRGKAMVNWCPNDQTVLANEQVIDGKCERCEALVEQKELEQWFFKITDYAERLLSDLDPLNWPSAIKESQRNWIGKSEGALISFKVSGSSFQETIEVFTTRPDTIFGATYVVLAPEHPLTEKLVDVAKNGDDIRAYVKTASAKKEIERTAEGRDKTGIRIEGVSAINPGNKEEVPIWIADYVIGHYGTGAVMGVPGHDKRDFDFAKQYDLPIPYVVLSGGSVQPGWSLERYADEWNDHYSKPGKLINSGKFDGLDSESAKSIITKTVGGKLKTTYKFRDWLVSRQRYWGAPIPIVYDPEGKPHPIPEEYLPWLLPTDADYKPKGTSPLGTSKELLERTEKIFGKGWRPETDTMDGFVDNSWYFLRYLDPKNDTSFSPLEKQKHWMPIALYSGGAEHTTVHVLYSRFFVKALYDMGLATVSEPYTVRLNRGIVLAEDGKKMSKRWGNVVNPDEQVALVGADAVRMYLAFIGPYNVVGSFPWSTNGLIGVRKFLERVYGLAEVISDATPSPELELLVNQSIKKVGEDIESMKMNTAVSQLMILSNAMTAGKVPRNSYEVLLKLLAPFAPHLAEEIWQTLGHTGSIHLEKWPAYDENKLLGDVVAVAVQENGKTRGTVTVPRGATQDEVIRAVRDNDKLKKLAVESASRVIFVTDKILNIVFRSS